MKSIPLLDPISSNLQNPEFWQVMYEIEQLVVKKYAWKFCYSFDDLSAESIILDKLVAAVKTDVYKTLPDEKENYRQLYKYLSQIANNTMTTTLSSLHFEKVKREAIVSGMTPENSEDPFKRETGEYVDISKQIKEKTVNTTTLDGKPIMKVLMFKYIEEYGTTMAANRKIRERVMAETGVSLAVARVTLSHCRRELGISRKAGKGNRINAWQQAKKVYYDGISLGEFQRRLARYTDSSHTVGVYLGKLRKINKCPS